MMLNAIIAIGCSLMYVLPFTITFAIARFFGGFVCGLAANSTTYNFEMSPIEVVGAYGCAFQINICTGILIAYSMALPLPLSDFESSAWTNWVYPILLLPIVFAALQLGLLYFYFVHDTPKWLVDNGRIKDAQAILALIYTPSRAERELDNLQPGQNDYRDDQSANSDDYMLGKESGGEVGYLDLLKRPHLKPTLIGFGLSVLSQACGINVIIFYSTELLKRAGGEGTVHWMTVLVGLANLLPTFATPFIIERLGRKLMMVIGYIGMAACNILVAYFSSINANPWLVLTCILVYLAFYEMSIGTVFWIYIAETMIDKSIGIAVGINWLTAAIVVGTLLALLSPDALGLFGTFYFYGALCILSLIFILVFVHESKREE